MTSMIYRSLLIPGLTLAAVSVSAGEAPRPHIILMMSDDLGWQDVGFHGSKIKTPHLDRLAREGKRLDQFYVQPVCTPTRGALMTGRYPIRLGLQCGVVRPWAKHGLPLDERTLPEALKSAGYATTIVGKWHLGHHDPAFLPTRRGFDRQYGHYNGAINYFTHTRDGGHDWHRDDQRNDDKGYATDLIADEAVRMISGHPSAAGDKPLFLYVPFNAPHTPLQAPEDQIARNTGFKNKDRQVHAAMVTSMDDAIGRILAACSEHLPQENTLFFFCSDNGGMNRFGSNGDLRGQKGQLYEGGVRVPTIIAWKGKLEPGVVAEPLHIVDLFPTLLGLAGVEEAGSKPLDGKDAWPTIANGQASPHEFILHNVTPFQGALRMGDWKLVHNGGVAANVTSYDGPHTWELFDIRNDPFEKTNLAKEKPEIFNRMRKKLSDLADEAVEPNIPPNVAPDGFVFPKVWGHSD
jgi:arylsulfatase A-like enzyme